MGEKDNLKGKLASEDNFSFDSSKLNFGNDKKEELKSSPSKQSEVTPEEFITDYIKNDLHFAAFIDYYTVTNTLYLLNAGIGVNKEQAYNEFVNVAGSLKISFEVIDVYLCDVLDVQLDKVTNRGLIKELEKLLAISLSAFNEDVLRNKVLAKLSLNWVNYIKAESTDFSASMAAQKNPVTKLSIYKIKLIVYKIFRDQLTNIGLSDFDDNNISEEYIESDDKMNLEEQTNESISTFQDSSKEKNTKSGTGKLPLSSVVIMGVVILLSSVGGYLFSLNQKESNLKAQFFIFSKRYLESPDPSSSMGYGVKHENYTVYATPYLFGGGDEKEHLNNSKIYLYIEFDANEDINNYAIEHVCKKNIALIPDAEGSWKDFNTSGVLYYNDNKTIKATLFDDGTIKVNGTVNAFSGSKRKRTINLNNITLNALSNFSPEPTWEEAINYRAQFVIDGPVGTLYENASVEEIKALEEKRKRALEIEDSLIHNAFINLDAKTRAKVALMGKDEGRDYLMSLIK